MATTSSKGRKTTDSAKDKEKSGREDNIETAPASRVEEESAQRLTLELRRNQSKLATCVLLII